MCAYIASHITCVQYPSSKLGNENTKYLFKYPLLGIKDDSNFAFPVDKDFHFRFNLFYNTALDYSEDICGSEIFRLSNCYFVCLVLNCYFMFHYNRWTERRQQIKYKDFGNSLKGTPGISPSHRLPTRDHIFFFLPDFCIFVLECMVWSGHMAITHSET